MEKASAAIHPDDRHKVEEIRAAVTNPAINSYQAEYRVIGIEDGVERWIRTEGCTYELGNPKAFIGTVLDITEERGGATRQGSDAAGGYRSGRPVCLFLGSVGRYCRSGRPYQGDLGGCLPRRKSILH